MLWAGHLSPKELRRRAEAGDAEAEWALGMRLEKRDPARALRWLERSARKDARNAATLGRFLLQGRERGVPRAPRRAVRWLRRSARGGEPEGMRLLGIELLRSVATPRDVPAGKRWLRKALATGQGEAALELGRWAWLLERDVRGARRWAKEAMLFEGDLDAYVLDEWLQAKTRWDRALDSTRPQDRDEFLRGVSNLHRGRTPAVRRAGLALLRRAAAAGSVEAPLALAFALVMGEAGDADPDSAEARRWFDVAARRDPVAAACLGRVLFCSTDGGSSREMRAKEGRLLRRAAPAVPWARMALFEWSSFARTPRDPGRRRRYERGRNDLLRAAAEAGVPMAENYWGETLRDGDPWGVRRDPGAAAAWFRRAAARGQPDAQLSLGCAYHEGKGVRRDDRESVRLYRAAVRRESAAAMNNLARCYRAGDGVRKDPRQAVAWLRRSAGAGDRWATGQLAAAYFEGDGARKDPSEALRLARQLLAEEEQIDGGAIRGLGEAIRELGRGYDEALGEAHHVVGGCAAKGIGGPKDDVRAFRHYRSAATAGHRCAAYDVGVAYLEGKGTKRDRRQARRWLEKALRLGETRARKRLREMSVPRR